MYSALPYSALPYSPKLTGPSHLIHFDRDFRAFTPLLLIKQFHFPTPPPVLRLLLLSPKIANKRLAESNKPPLKGTVKI